MFILFIFDTAIHQTRDFMHIKYTMARWKNVAFLSIILSLMYVCNDESVDCVHGWYSDHHRGFMHINILRLCAKIGFLCLFCHNCCVFLNFDFRSPNCFKSLAHGNSVNSSSLNLLKI